MSVGRGFSPKMFNQSMGDPKVGVWHNLFSYFFSLSNKFRELAHPRPPPNKKKRKTSTDLSFFRLFGVEGLLLLLDLGCHAHHAGGSDACESTRAFVCFDLHVLCLERLCHLGVMTIPAGWPKKGDVFCDINIWKRMLHITEYLYKIFNGWGRMMEVGVSFLRKCWTSANFINLHLMCTKELSSWFQLIKVCHQHSWWVFRVISKAICVSLITQAFFKMLGNTKDPKHFLQIVLRYNPQYSTYQQLP